MRKFASLGLGGGIIITLFAASFMLFLYGQATNNPDYNSVFFSFVGSQLSNQSAGSSAGQIGEFQTRVNAVIALTIGTGVFAFALGFPNPYSLFAPVVVFIMGFVSVPIALFNSESSLPLELRAFLTGIFTILIVIAGVQMHRGTSV